MKNLMRLRQSSNLREMLAKGDFKPEQLVQPLFLVEGMMGSEPIKGLPGNSRHGYDSALDQIGKDVEAGVKNIIIFPVPAHKSDSKFDNSFSHKFIETIRKQYKDSLTIWVDTCLCSYTKSGHCGIFHGEKLDLESTLKSLSEQALGFANSGAHGISPSDMMDGRVAKIRETLNANGFQNVPIMSYSTKFASSFYGPFRNAASSAPSFGDRRSYQLDVRNKADAIASSVRCADEGADLLMVKPGLTSIDLISEIAEKTGKPVGAYQVSGEYASLALLSEQGLLDFENGLLETWRVFGRAGAQFLITYGARLARNLGVR